MKALILAAGRGRRLGSQSTEHNKCMLPMFGRPLIEYSLENAVRAGADEIVIVVGYRAEQIINAYGIEHRGVRMQYVLQEDPRGLVHAIECSEEAIGGRDFMLFLADEIRKTYAVIEDDRDQRIYRLIEKPRRPPNQMRGTGNCIFRSRIFEYVPLTPINQNRQERELPDLIQCAIDDGLAVKSFDIGDGYVNINTPDDIEVAERSEAARFRPESSGRS